MSEESPGKAVGNTRGWKGSLGGRESLQSDRCPYRALNLHVKLPEGFIQLYFFFAQSTHCDTHSLHAWVGSRIKQMGKANIIEKQNKQIN